MQPASWESEEGQPRPHGRRGERVKVPERRRRQLKIAKREMDVSVLTVRGLALVPLVPSPPLVPLPSAALLPPTPWVPLRSYRKSGMIGLLPLAVCSRDRRMEGELNSNRENNSLTEQWEMGAGGFGGSGGRLRWGVGDSRAECGEYAENYCYPGRRGVVM